MARRTLEMDASTVKALAHPMRVQILRILRLRKKASVTSLATELGETTGATSYHLRQLARHGFVEEFDDSAPPEKRSGRRQRWWRMAVDELHTTGFGFMDDADTREAFTFLLREDLDDRGRRLGNWFATAREWPEEWQRASSDMSGNLELDPIQTRALADELAAVVARYRDVEPGPDTRIVDVQFAVFPTDTDARP
ncbi:MAG: ArsR/SmtB family transcription factor [Jatrophihabitans sp.]|uniref:ArsR/SmtB family transcription factor n=1 Tax=Jatrophihabitans sp. TaxID=1932789 RepID=UPI003914812E